MFMFADVYRIRPAARGSVFRITFSRPNGESRSPVGYIGPTEYLGVISAQGCSINGYYERYQSLSSVNRVWDLVSPRQDHGKRRDPRRPEEASSVFLTGWKDTKCTRVYHKRNTVVLSLQTHEIAS